MGGELNSAGFSLTHVAKFWKELQETNKQAKAYTSAKQNGFFQRFLGFKIMEGFKFWS